ncbi:Maltose/maltodextrin import ATP-binding protein MalK [Novipirellula aureliae]|uniref:Maltose/maltodextrin import ATP-binding protein MalK n=1 Tax=Novipirellula aureliae TaxID=2527966 RepID=A0A5C6DHP0_9BACT|nr:ABC transporter ATP-binding protein [Novipirellula aureliae]TWU35231.1 Maltose/maltodextrin import ATP-binding protein MalK [Novipirellula aureliae]
MIELRDVTTGAGEFRLTDLSLQVQKGEYAVLMGRTGRGKTTILEALCGLRRIEHGKIFIDETDVTDWMPGDRQIGYVPQDLALFPTLSVAEHLTFALKLRGHTREAMNRRCEELSEMLGIASLLNRKIDGLSGGEAQRVALGRALSFHPNVLLLDEPLSALDESTRLEMRKLLRRVKDAAGVTTLHVTHSSDEAASLADRLFVLDGGKITTECVANGSFGNVDDSQ